MTATQDRGVRARTRPLADARIDALASEPGEISRRWVLALLEERPLERLAELPLEVLAREAPRLCSEVLRALGSDAELERLARSPEAGVEEDDSAARLASMTAARDARELVADVEALRGVLGEALETALAGESRRTLADVADRLASACAGALQAALAAGAETWAGASPGVSVAPVPGEIRVGAPGTAAGPAVLVDEAPVGGAAFAAGPRPPAARVSPAEPPGEEIVIRAADPGEGPAAWMRAIGDQLERHARDRAPFAVLLAEIVEPGEAGEIGRLAGAVEELLEMELGIAAGSHHGDRGAALTRERPGRYWLLVPGVDRRAAETLAERLRRLARGLGTSTPGGVELALGTSSCPQDGTEPAALAAHADVGLYAARSALRRARPGGGFERRR